MFASQIDADRELVVEAEWIGAQWDALTDTTREKDVEGAIRSGKTVLCLTGEAFAAFDNPGINILLSRWTEGATHSLLLPVWRTVCRDLGIPIHWNSKEECDEFDNGSRAYIRGLKAQAAAERYSKFRGLTLARAYIDQGEEVPEDVYLEVAARLSQPGHPHQITISPNSVEENHWLAKRFPAGNPHPRRKYFHLSVQDNAHNLDDSVIPSLFDIYPPAHPKHRTMVLGIRGVNVIGEPVYGPAFVRAIHVGPCPYDPALPLEEALDFGHHHPCVVWRQRSPLGQTRYLGAILGQDMYLEDFLPEVMRYRSQWFPDPVEVKSCCDPAGTALSSQGLKDTGLKVLARCGFVNVRTKKDANRPAVRNAVIESISGQMRRRCANRAEAFQISDDEEHWLRISATDVVIDQFLADGFEAGYVWDEHVVTDGRKQFRMPKKDKWFEHSQNCLSSDTEMLTTRGWVACPQVTEADQVATVNLETDAIEYQVPHRLIRRPHRGELLHFQGRLDALVTPDHRMVVYPRFPVQARYRGPRKGPTPPDREPAIIRAAQNTDPFDLVKLTGTWAGVLDERVLIAPGRRGGAYELDPGDFAEFLGWYIAEGTANSCVRTPGHGYQVIISQQPGPKYALLEGLLAQLPWRWYRTRHGFQASSEALWRHLRPIGNTYTKRVPSWIRCAPPHIIRRFLVGAILGDGHQRPDGARQYFTVSRGLADDIQELFLKIGRSASIIEKPAVPYLIRGRSGTNTVVQYHVNEWRTDGASVRDSRSRPTIEAVPYEGEVYCATVPNGTLIVRRHGRPFITGNCVEYLEYILGAMPKPKAKKPAPGRRERFAPRSGGGGRGPLAWTH